MKAPYIGKSRVIARLENDYKFGSQGRGLNEPGGNMFVTRYVQRIRQNEAKGRL